MYRTKQTWAQKYLAQIIVKLSEERSKISLKRPTSYDFVLPSLGHRCKLFHAMQPGPKKCPMFPFIITTSPMTLVYGYFVIFNIFDNSIILYSHISLAFTETTRQPYKLWIILLLFRHLIVLLCLITIQSFDKSDQMGKGHLKLKLLLFSDYLQYNYYTDVCLKDKCKA